MLKILIVINKLKLNFKQNTKSNYLYFSITFLNKNFKKVN